MDWIIRGLYGDKKEFYMKRELLNLQIVFIRVVSMICIVLCHIVCYYTFIPGHAVLGQVFNVGVYVFLLISGYLYGGKTISNFRKWIIVRWRKIVMPMLIVVLLDAIILFMIGENILADSILYFLNLQGLSFVSGAFSVLNPGVANLGALWFVTIIMLCYCLIPTLQLLRKVINKYSIANKIYVFTIIVLIVMSFVLSTFANISIIYFVVFYIGYVLGNTKFQQQQIGMRRYLCVCCLAIVAQFLRLYFRTDIDGTRMYIALVEVTHTVFSIWIFLSAFMIQDFFPIMMKKIVGSKFFLWLDAQSFYIYLSHGLFCMGTGLNVFRIIDNIWICTLIFILLTFIFSYAVRKIAMRIDQVLINMIYKEDL